MSELSIGFDKKGLGDVLKNLLVVPPNQRPYAWEEAQVKDFFEDLNEAILDDEDEYFMGTIVLVNDNNYLIADGQQRLATSSIALARIRDLLNSLDSKQDANALEVDHLKKYVREVGQKYLLEMNVEDAEYFRRIAIDSDWITNRPVFEKTKHESNEKIYEASAQALSFLTASLGKGSDSSKIKILNKWASYIATKAKVILVIVSDENGAYRMFETLNDRGLRASQIDILKNYLFSKVENHQLDQIKSDWGNIRSVLADTFDDVDDQMLKYIKYFWIMQNGLVKDRELSSEIKKKIKKGSKALEFASAASSAVTDYVAIFNENDLKWKDHQNDTKENLRVLTKIINIEQILPLAFAVSHKFNKVELEKAIRLFVVWSVRLRLGNSGRAGRLDKQYADLAFSVGTGAKTTATALRAFLADKVPDDLSFEKAAAVAKVRQSQLSRYYLIELEKFLYRGTGEKIPSSNIQRLNLEHILPKSYTAKLGVSKPDHGDLLHRLGNQTIMQSEWNKNLANLPFDRKKPVYKKSEIGITKSLSDINAINRVTIDERQKIFAKAAPKVWSLKFNK